MKLWLLTRTDHWSYDDYDSAVVAAETEDAAKRVQISAYSSEDEPYYCWTTPEHINAICIGDAVPETEAGAILGSFNAG